MKPINILFIGLSLVVSTAILVPNFVKPRPAGQSACVSTLIWYKELKEEWRRLNPDKKGIVPTGYDLLGEKWGASMSSCPSGGTYTFGTQEEDPVCSIGGPRHSIPNGLKANK